MPDVQVIFSGSGPIQAGTQIPFQAESDMPAAIFFSGSGWSPTAAVLLSIELNLDGTDIGVAQVFTNEANSHKTMVPALATIDLTQGSHYIQLEPSSNTVTDNNDFFTVTIVYD